MKNYPFVNCISPVVVKNNSTGEKMIVGCGKCCACRNQKNSQLALQCKLESKSNSETWFITLTYDQQHIPLMKPMAVYGEHGTKWMFVSTCSRLEENGLIINECSYSIGQIDQLCQKCNLDGFLGYLFPRDAQLFIKRLRKYISKISNENIRFFLCGEFGPKSLRPHFHIILWFNDRQISENLVSIVNQAWQFGRTDTQKVNKDCSQYVAGYLNSPHTLPRVYQTGKSKPFSNHSQFLGQDVLACKKEEVYKLTPTDFVRRSVELNGSVTEFSLWRSIKNRFFPRCRDYATLSHDERLRVYTLADCFAGRQATHRKPLQVAQEIVESLLNGNWDTDLSPLMSRYDFYYGVREFFLYPKRNMELLTYEEQQKYLNSGMYPISPEQLDYRVHAWLLKITNIIYRDLSISCQFCFDICDGIKDKRHRETMLSMIERFYDQLELDKLERFYIQQKEYYDEFNFDAQFKDLFYNNESISELTESEIFKVFKYDSMRMADEHMKHKRQNDANRYWFKERGL